MPVVTVKRPGGEPALQPFNSDLTAVQISEMANKQSKSEREISVDSATHSERDVEALSLVLAGLYHEGTREEILERILTTLKGPKDWRSAWGLAQATGYYPEAISEVLESNSYAFEICPIRPAGIKFYRLRDK